MDTAGAVAHRALLVSGCVLSASGTGNAKPRDGVYELSQESSDGGV